MDCVIRRVLYKILCKTHGERCVLRCAQDKKPLLWLYAHRTTSKRQDLIQGYTQHAVLELTLKQLHEVAQRHLHAPVGWGEESYDRPEMREKMAQRWWEQAREAEDPLFINAWIHNDTQHVAAFLWAVRRETPDPHAMIHSLWVDETLRRQGVARALKEDVERWARSFEARWIQTKISTKNNNIRALNASMGYEDTYISQKKMLPTQNTAKNTKENE